MRSIGDVRDGFVRENGVWYEKHVIGRYVFTGNESITFNAEGFTVQGLFFEAQSKSIVKSNRYIYYINATYNEFISKDFAIAFLYESSNNLYIRDKDYNNVNDFKLKLKELYDLKKPLYVIYILKSPTLLPCTPEQTAVLEEIRKKAKTYKGGTHIYSTDEVSPIFDVEYHVDMQSENENLQSQLESLEARVSLLEGGE